jgi:hypothetical protein
MSSMFSVLRSRWSKRPEGTRSSVRKNLERRMPLDAYISSIGYDKCKSSIESDGICGRLCLGLGLAKNCI